MLYNDRESRLNCASRFGANSCTRNKEIKRLSNDNIVDTNRRKNAMFPSPNAFRVYEKISQKNRYIPRKWTQEEFEAALPQRFREGNNTSVARRNTDIDLAPKVKQGEENELKKVKEQVLPPSENTSLGPSTTAFQYPQKGIKINEKISSLKAIFEGDKSESLCDQLNRTEDVCDLESCKKKEDKLTSSNERGEKEDVKDGEVKCEDNESEATKCPLKTCTSFVDSCLQCLLNIDQIVQFVSNTSLTCTTCPSIDPAILKNLLKTALSFDKSNSRKPWSLCLQDVFHKLYDEVTAQSRSWDEALKVLLETFVEVISGQDKFDLRTVFQGKFCHARICEHCETVVREYQPFMFLNPTLPPSITPDNHPVDIKMLSCTDGFWHVTSREISVPPGITVADLKEELAKHSDFFGPCDVSAIKIGAVKNSRIKVFDDTKDLSEPRVDPASSIFVFNVINYQPEKKNTNKQDKNCTETTKSRSLGFANMSYHLFFNCGLCLNDDKDVGLLMHQSCGGMVCRDCLNEISQTNGDWKLCPCPICERPIDLDKEFCSMKINAENDKIETQPDVVCGVVFRVGGPCNEGMELFGFPVLVSVPQETTGYHLYRSIGYLLPQALPMKDKTSFTLHKVDRSGLHCGTCSSTNCSGCLLHIDDNVTFAPNTYLAVHFDHLEEESKRVFGVITPGIPRISATRELFDEILQSCMDASSSNEALCPKCFHISKTTSSISEFPQLLILHLNGQFASEGLPANMTISDVDRFFISERDSEFGGDIKQSLAYHLVSVVLKENRGLLTAYKVCAPGPAEDRWLFYDDTQAVEIHPTLLYLTSDSVLFYQLVKDPTSTPSESTSTGYMHELESTAGDNEGTRNGNDHSRPKHFSQCDLNKANRSDTITEGQTRRSSRKHSHRQKPNKKPDLEHHMFKLNNPFEPGECLSSKDLNLNENERLQEPCFHGSRLSLGEIGANSHLPSKGIAGTALDSIDTISPISTTDAWKSENHIIRETEKLMKAVKREDAYNIVCTLKRGADPCLLVNDLSALHLAVGMKSDQRRSMVNFLLKYCSDVNVPTADGTTPVHVAAAWGYQDALELLIDHGGDPFDLTDFEGNSAFDLAAKNCSTYLRSIYNRQRNSTFSELSSNSYSSLPIHLTSWRASKDKDHIGHNGKRLEDIVRSNIGLPSFVEGSTYNSRVHHRWLRRRLRNIRKSSTGIFRRLRKMGGIRRRSRIGVMVSETPRNTP